MKSNQADMKVIRNHYDQILIQSFFASVSGVKVIDRQNTTIKASKRNEAQASKMAWHENDKKKWNEGGNKEMEK